MEQRNDREKTFVAIATGHIELGKFLKLVGAIRSGGSAKAFLAANGVSVNGSPETRRGKKLYPGDAVGVAGRTYELTHKDV